MKHGKRPTREQRKLMQTWKLNSDDWLVVKDEPHQMTLVHRHFDKKTKIVPKGERDERCQWQEERIERVAVVGKERGCSARRSSCRVPQQEVKEDAE